MSNLVTSVEPMSREIIDDLGRAAAEFVVTRRCTETGGITLTAADEDCFCDVMVLEVLSVLFNELVSLLVRLVAVSFFLCSS
jgi:hypothetical protein